jgi:hypothetical protein
LNRVSTSRARFYFGLNAVAPCPSVHTPAGRTDGSIALRQEELDRHTLTKAPEVKRECDALLKTNNVPGRSEYL